MTQRRVLFLVSDFAPLTSVGRVRTEKFCRYLPDFGWQPLVLTLAPPAWTVVDEALLADVPPETKVVRVHWPQPFETPVWWMSRLAGKLRSCSARTPQTFQTGEEPIKNTTTGAVGKIASIVDRAKRYLNHHILIPDEVITAVPGMIRAGQQLVRRHNIDVMIASVPSFCPWLAGVAVRAATRCPLVVDYRDLWYQDVLREWISPVRRRFELAMERFALQRTDAVVTTSESKTGFVRDLTHAQGKQFQTIYNGFDPQDIEGLPPAPRPPEDEDRLVLLHTGRLYKNRRLEPLITSIVRLVSAGRIKADTLRIRIIGEIEAAQRERLRSLCRTAGLNDLLLCDGYLTRRESLARQKSADALLLVVDKGPTSDGVIPSKVFEYMGQGKFIFALCPPGDIRNLLSAYGRVVFASPDRGDEIDAAVMDTVSRFSADPVAFRTPLVRSDVFSRRNAAMNLASMLDAVTARRAEQERAASVRWVGEHAYTVR